MYNTQYVELLASKQYQAMEELWIQARSDGTDANCDITVQCICCTTYVNWKSSHPSNDKLLRECVSKQQGYELFPDEKVVVLENNLQVDYTGVIRSTSCTGTATKSGDHPYQCASCHTLTTEMPTE